MNLREQYEEFELHNLSKFACKSSCTLGRKRQESKCEVRTEFQRDRDRIVHSKAFRRLIHKTQVFLAPEGDHYRTRLTHTLEVSQISRTIARALRLNEDLTEAIALGHDLGHTPFGHKGESVINEILKDEGGFRHNEQSLRVVDILESKTEEVYGLNLTEEVRDGILNHSGEQKPITLEGQVVKLSDRIAYLNHDIDDSIRAGIICERDIPYEILRVLGNSHSERITNMIMNIVNNSANEDSIHMTADFQLKMGELRDYMFDNIYLNDVAKSEENKSEFLLKQLFEYYLNNFSVLPCYYHSIADKYGSTNKELVKDYIAGMTDRYAINQFKMLYVPNPWDK